MRCASYSPLPTVRAFVLPFRDRLLCPLLTSAPRSGCLTAPPVPSGNTAQTSRGKTASLHRTPAGFTALALDGYGLRDSLLTRPTGPASHPVPVRRVATLLCASFRPRLAATPLRFANPSPPSGWVEDSHLQANVHARHTKKRPAAVMAAGPVLPYLAGPMPLPLYPSIDVERDRLDLEPLEVIGVGHDREELPQR